MNLVYETKRLTLQILPEHYATQVLDFYQRNKDYFSQFEPDYPPDFYTVEYQKTLLHYEFQIFLKFSGLRFWIHLKEQPSILIGTISFQNILRSVYQSCVIGYKFDPNYQHQGYASEAIQKAISIVFDEWKLHRIEALVLPDNLPSIHLLEKNGFLLEGICHSCIYLHSSWTDHLRYSLIRP